MMLLTLPVLLYQLFFVALLFVASRFGSKMLLIVLVCCLIWTSTHIFLLPLALLQAAVIITSYLVFRRGASNVSLRVKRRTEVQGPGDGTI